MTVAQLKTALAALQSDENANIDECEIRVYCENHALLVNNSQFCSTMYDGEMKVTKVERDSENSMPEVTIYFDADAD